jgi:hypothetical protein
MIAYPGFPSFVSILRLVSLVLLCSWPVLIVVLLMLLDMQILCVVLNTDACSRCNRSLCSFVYQEAGFHVKTEAQSVYG